MENKKADRKEKVIKDANKESFVAREDDSSELSVDAEVSTVDYDSVEDNTEVVNKIKKLKAKLKLITKERSEYLSGWQRARADLINERKEFAKNSSRIADNARTDLIVNLLTVLDGFDMAFANKEAWEQVDTNWRTGVEHIHAQLLSTLAEYGLTPFDPLHEPVNPKEHESLGTTPTNNKKEDNTVIEVLQKGYRQGKVIIRPAKVKVAVYGDNLN